MGISTSMNLGWFISSTAQTSPAAGGGVTFLTDAGDSNIKVHVYPQWFMGVYLTWEIPSSWGACKFNVYFSPTGLNQGDELVKLNETLLDSPFFQDLTMREHSKFKHGYYVVEVYIVGQKRLFRSQPATWTNNRRKWVDLRATEIQRREYLLLSKFVGVKSYVFKRKMYGTRCPRCWNPTQSKVMEDHCPVCMGTSWEGGYYASIATYLQFDPTPNNVVFDQQGIVEPNQISAWTISIPEIAPRDIIIRAGDWNVYYVAGVGTTELQSVTVKQTMTLTQLSRQDVENQLMARVPDSKAASFLSTFPTPFAGRGNREGRFPQNQVNVITGDDYEWAKDVAQQNKVLPTPATQLDTDSRPTWKYKL